MRVPILLFFSLCLIKLNAQEIISLKIGERKDLVEKIKPVSKFNWCYYETDPIDNDYILIYSKGAKIKLDSIPTSGFITHGHQTPTYEVIAYKKDSKLNMVLTTESFSKFLGEIDNIEEAILYLESKELEYVFYNYDEKTKSTFLVYNETRKNFIIYARFVPWIKQNTSIDNGDEILTEKEKKEFKIELNKKTKEIKIIE